MKNLTFNHEMWQIMSSTLLGGKSVLRDVTMKKSWVSKYHGNPRVPLCHSPKRNNALIKPYEGTPMVNSPLISPYFLAGWHWGVPLGSHDLLGF